MEGASVLSTEGRHLSKRHLSESRTPNIKILIDISLCIKWKVFCFVYK